MKSLHESLSETYRNALTKGYIWLPRELLSIAFDPEAPGQEAALLYLVLLASSAYKEYEEKVSNSRIRLQQGETLTTVRKLAKTIRLEYWKVARLLQQFEAEGLISMRNWKKHKVIKVIHYRRFTHYVTTPDTKPTPPKNQPPKPDPIAELEKRFGHLVKPLPRNYE